MDFKAADGSTPLIVAAGAGKGGDCIAALLAAGASPNVTNRKGMSPLLVAAARGDGGAVGALLAGGADASAATPEGMGAMELAIAADCAPVVAALVQGGVSAGATRAGLPFLDLAAQQGRWAGVRWLALLACGCCCCLGC